MIDEIRRRLAAYKASVLPEEARARAAVLIPLYYKRGELHVVLTKRGDGLGSHRGEICFPGGSWEKSDFDLAVTALRESNEEIGLHPDDVEIIGKVDDIVTISQFHVTPFVGEIDPAVCPYTWCCQEREVAEILEVPLSHLLDCTNLVELPVQRNGEVVMRPGYRFGEHTIWGATQRMLANFLDVSVREGVS
jgi:8-oxo-dGTP pyrophosphatase MutT (NUDIX family)